ncbi:MAG: succinate dehydrogenase / fumarate reductase cytochrome b subunit [Burkholderiaceae bacterium]|jgi:succinate dehydrogenase / fumarate reductase cytochrome b subunit
MPSRYGSKGLYCACSLINFGVAHKIGKITELSSRGDVCMSEATKTNRPEFRNIHVTQLANYRLPLAGLISILHRISGFMMFALLPFILYLLDQSLMSEGTFEYFKSITANWFVKLVLLAVSWAFIHHFCAGIRHLFMDNHIGIEKDSARKSAVAVFAVSLPLAALVALKLFGAF